MRGTILGIDLADGTGAIAGDDGLRYRFSAAEWRGGHGAPQPGTPVDFDAKDGNAAGVYPIAGAAAVPPSPLGQAPIGQAYEKSHVAAGLLAFFLGAWGVHKFYLGYNSEGVVMLVGTIVSFVLSIVIIGIFGLMAIGVIALVEAIIYLTKTDAEFDAIYVKGRRPWF